MALRPHIKVPSKKPRTWDVSLIRSRAHFLGFVEAPDAKAEQAAVGEGAGLTSLDVTLTSRSDAKIGDLRMSLSNPACNELTNGCPGGISC